MSKKNEKQDEQATKPLSEGTPAGDEDAAGAVPGEDATPGGKSGFGSKNFRIAAAGVAAAVVAGALFLAPGDRLIGIDSSSAGIERHHEDDGDYHDFDEDGPHEGYEGYGDDRDGPHGDRKEIERPSGGKGRSSEGSSPYPGTPSDPAPLGTSQS
jgi:hypothetical protein